MTEANRDQTRTEGAAKRHYEPPAVEGTAAFETLALTCVKTEGTYSCDVGGASNS